MARLSSTRILALVILAIVLVGCRPDDRAKPGDKVTLTFTGKSNSEYFRPLIRSIFAGSNLYGLQRFLWILQLIARTRKPGKVPLAASLFLTAVKIPRQSRSCPERQ
jgi:hypothetical protein